MWASSRLRPAQRGAYRLQDGGEAEAAPARPRLWATVPGPAAFNAASAPIMPFEQRSDFTVTSADLQRCVGQVVTSQFHKSLFLAQLLTPT